MLRSPRPVRLAALAAAFLAGCDPSASVTDLPDDPPAAAGPEWVALAQGATGSDYVNAAVELPGGDVMAVGFAAGSTTVAGRPFDGSDGDGFVARLASDGTARWVRPLVTGAGTGTVTDIAVVPGGVAVLGRFRGTATIGSTTATSGRGQAGFVARLTGDGSPTWVQVVSSSDDVAPTEMDADASGAVTVGGSYRSDLAFGSVAAPAATSYDAWYARLSPGGAVAWVRTFGGASSDNVNAVAMAPDGAAYVVGSFIGSATVAGQTLASAGVRDGVALRVNPDGSAAWVRHLSGPGANDYFTGVGASAAGVAASGIASGAVSIGGQTASGTMFAVGLAPDGSVRWLTSATGAGACSAGMDAAGGLLVGGTYFAPDAFGGRVGRFDGGTDGYVARFTPTGSLDWIRTQNGPSNENVCSLSAGATYAYASGSFAAAATLDGAAWPAVSLGFDDGFLARFRLAPAI